MSIVTHYLRYTHIHHFIHEKFTSYSYRLVKVEWTATGGFQRCKVVRFIILWNLVDRRPHTSLGFDLDKAPGLTSPTRGLEQPEFVGTAYVSLPTQEFVLLTGTIHVYYPEFTKGSGSMFISTSGCVLSFNTDCGLHCLSSLLAL